MKKFLLPLLLLANYAHAQQAVGVIENPTLRCHVTSTVDLFIPFGDNALPSFEAHTNLNSNVEVRHLAPGIYRIIIENNGHATHKKLLIAQR